MSKVFCKECNLVYLESEFDKLHKVNNLKDHNKILEKNSMEAVEFLSQKLSLLEERFKKSIEESYKAEYVLLSKIQENRLLLNMFRSENPISLLKPDFELLNCIYTMDKSKSFCNLYRTKNIIYFRLEFNGKIEGKSGKGKAAIAIKMPMWLIYTGFFSFEKLENCLSKESKMESLVAKYEQNANKLIIYINQNEFEEQTYWEKNNNSNFIINGNFFVEPPSRKRLGKFYMFNPILNKVIYEHNNSLSLTDNWEEGCLFEVYEENKIEKRKINDKFLNISNGDLKLDKNENNDIKYIYIPGYADIILIQVMDNKMQKFVEGKNNELILGKEPVENSQFVLIPKYDEYKNGKKD